MARFPRKHAKRIHSTGSRAARCPAYMPGHGPKFGDRRCTKKIGHAGAHFDPVSGKAF